VDATDAAGLLVHRVRSRAWGVAASAIVGDTVDCTVEAGDDPMTTESVFQVGSLTKTVTGVLLGCAVVRGEAALDTAVGEILDRPGQAATVTLLALATQRSGLPPLPPNLDLAKVDRGDPYGAYTADDLVEALGMIEAPAGQDGYQYSNFGFMLLGLLLSRIAGKPYAQLARERVFDPMGLATAGCPPADQDRMPGYALNERTRWWTTNLPGAGGVGMSIRDLTTYLQAHLAPDDTPLGEAIRLATANHAAPPAAMGLGWEHEGGGCWHNGATGGFRSFAAFHRPTHTAVALLANSADPEWLDGVGFRTLTEMVRAQTDDSDV
jgi:D-alanyl-D-alanine-carboxypeptidase/D-alanyl-D-alanine-endopeptidase